MTREAKLSELFLTALKAIGVTPTPTYYSPDDFTMRKGLLYRPSEDAPAVRLKPKLEFNAEMIQDAMALEGPEGLAKVYGDLFGKVLSTISELPKIE